MTPQRRSRSKAGARPAVFALLALAALLAAPAATKAQSDAETRPRRCRIVDYGADMGNGSYRNMGGHQTGSDLEVDVDGDGETADDSVAMWPWKPDEPLNPSGPDYDLEAPSAVFYGGMVSYYANRPNGRLSEGFLNQNHELRDDFNFMDGATGPEEAFKAYGLYYWVKEDFLNGGDEHRVTFDDASCFGVHVSRYWEGFEESRGVVRDGDRFYISEATCEGVRKSHVFYPTKTKWALYEPTPPAGLGFDPEALEFREHEFKDVTAVGFAVARHTLARGRLQLKWHSFEAYATVHGPAVPSFHAPMVAVPADADTPAFFIGKTEVPYSLWQKVWRWAVSNQYLFDLARPGYIFDTDGDMGSMALCNSVYDATHPATGMTWLDAVAWCNALSEYEGRTPCYYHDAEHEEVFRKVRERTRPADYDWKPTVHVKWDADGFRLPTRAEWRLAALAGESRLGLWPDAAWIGANASGRTHPVGTKRANALGLHDTAGNVWEYTWDAPGASCDAGEQAAHTVLGGDFRYPASPLETARIEPGEMPWRGHYAVGLRVVRRESGAAAPPVTAPAVAGADMEADVPSWTIARGRPIPGFSLRAEHAWIGPRMVAIPEGGYVRSDEAQVKISPFYMSETEIMFATFRHVQQWAAMNGYELDGDGDMGSMDWRTGEFEHSPDEPVTDITWHTAMAWCNALSERLGKIPCYYSDEAKTEVIRRPNLWRIAMYRGTVGYVTGEGERRWLPVHVKWEADGFRLPTEAEWTYAFRGPQTEGRDFWKEHNAQDYGWIAANSGGRTHPVGGKPAGPFGLRDMVGNVREWVWDWPAYDYYRPRNPKGGDDYELFGKRLCGLGYRSPAERYPYWQEDPSTPRPYFGFRVVRCDAGVHPEKETFTPEVVLDIDEEDYDPLQGQVHRANLRRDGHFQATGVPELHGVKWAFETGGPVRSSPVVVDGILYVGSDDRHIYALDAESGEVRWKLQANAPVRSSAAVAGGVVYMGDDSGVLHALDAKTGEVRWQNKDKWHRPLDAAPAVAYGVVFAGTANGGYWAMDAESGEIAWRFRFSRGPASQSAAAVRDGRVYLPTSSIHGNLADIRTELRVWHSNVGAALGSPAIAGDRIVLTERWVTALDWETGSRLWEFQTQAPRNKGLVMNSSPAVAGGRVFFGTDYGRVYAVGLEDGREQWRFETQGKAVQSSPSVADGVVYVGCVDEHLYALDAATGALRWKQKCGGWVNTAPWVDDGVVFVGCLDGKVYAIR